MCFRRIGYGPQPHFYCTNAARFERSCRVKVGVCSTKVNGVHFGTSETVGQGGALCLALKHYLFVDLCEIDIFQMLKCLFAYVMSITSKHFPFNGHFLSLKKPQGRVSIGFFEYKMWNESPTFYLKDNMFYWTLFVVCKLDL